MRKTPIHFKKLEMQKYRQMNSFALYQWSYHLAFCVYSLLDITFGG